MRPGKTSYFQGAAKGPGGNEGRFTVGLCFLEVGVNNHELA